MTYEEAIEAGVKRIRGAEWPQGYMLITEAHDALFYPDTKSPWNERTPLNIITGSYNWEPYTGPVSEYET